MKRLFYLMLPATGFPVLAREIAAPIHKKSYSGYTSYHELTGPVNNPDVSENIKKLEDLSFLPLSLMPG